MAASRMFQCTSLLVLLWFSARISIMEPTKELRLKVQVSPASILLGPFI